MPNTICWMCKATTGHKRLTSVRELGTEYAHRVLGRTYTAAFECQVCQGISVGLVYSYDGGVMLDGEFDQLTGDRLTWMPNPGSTCDYPDVPDHIAQAATEAYESHSQSHHRAAILLARSVIEAAAKNKGIASGSLQSKIDELAKQNLIRPHIQQVAHEIRLFGNDMAHGDFVAPVSGEESRLVIELMGEILAEVFESPAKLATVQQLVAARQSQTNQT